jgi:hypothetical protein
MCRRFDSVPVHKRVSLLKGGTLLLSNFSTFLVNTRVNTFIVPRSVTTVTGNPLRVNWNRRCIARERALVVDEVPPRTNHRSAGVGNLRTRWTLLHQRLVMVDNRADPRYIAFSVTSVRCGTPRKTCERIHPSLHSHLFCGNRCIACFYA